ncbi:MAG: acyl-CoA dehydrogenase [Thermoproteota archaeon]
MGIREPLPPPRELLALCNNVRKFAVKLMDELRDPCPAFNVTVHCIAHFTLRWAGRKVEGILSPALTETHGGSNIADVRTRAEVTGDGRAIITGEKVFSTNALYADYFLVLASTDAGPVLVLVPRSSAGVKVDELELEAYKCAGVGRVTFSGAEGEVVAGPGKDAYKLVLNALAVARLLVAAHALGMASKVLEHAVSVSLQRGSWAHQVVRHRLARAYALCAAARSYIEKAAEDVEKGSFDWALTSTAKYVAVEAALETLEAAARSLGGYAVHASSPIPETSKHLYALLAAEGTQDIQLEIISRSLERTFQKKASG